MRKQLFFLFKPSLKGQAIQLDLFIALIAVFLMLVLIYSTATTSLKRVSGQVDESALNYAASSFADYLVKEGLAKQENGLVYPHLLRPAQFSQINLTEISRQLKASIGISLYSLEGEPILLAGSVSQGECVKRIITIEGSDELGILKVCAH